MLCLITTRRWKKVKKVSREEEMMAIVDLDLLFPFFCLFGLKGRR